MTSRRAHRAVLALAMLALAPAVRSTGNAVAATPPTLPPGYMQLVDDTGTTTMAVPATWTDVVTTPLTSEDGTLPRTSAPGRTSSPPVPGCLVVGDGATACALLTAEEMTINLVENAASCPAELSARVAGQGAFWASVQIAGDEFTSSETCDEEDPADEWVSLELHGPTDDGCLSLNIENGEWRINDLSNSIRNQAG
jgi:hypothetical protein